jgi:hypothetical protein
LTAIPIFFTSKNSCVLETKIFLGKKWPFIKNETALVRKQQGYLPAWNHAN